jgi:GTP-binding protein EngB required for normal cell division
LSIDNAPEPSVRFVERGSIPLNNLYEKLNRYHRIIITGLPGVGKSEFIRQVIEKAIKENTYKGIFCLSAATGQTFQANVYLLAHELGLLEDPNMNIEIA